MRKYVGLTEKRMANKRFRKTEDAILKVFFGEDYYICVREVAEKVGVARSTIYNHHRAVREILPDYEKFILRKFKRMFRKGLRDKKVKLRSLYLKALLLMVQEKRIFGMLVKNERRVAIEKIILEMRTKIDNYARLPKNSEKMLKVYVSEVTELMMEWGKGGFAQTEIERLLNDIMYLTDTVRIRLRRLLDN